MSEDITPKRGIWPNILHYPPPEGRTQPTPAAGAASWFKAAKDFHPQAGLETQHITGAVNEDNS